MAPPTVSSPGLVSLNSVSSAAVTPPPPPSTSVPLQLPPQLEPNPTPPIFQPQLPEQSLPLPPLSNDLPPQASANLGKAEKATLEIQHVDAVASMRPLKASVDNDQKQDNQ